MPAPAVYAVFARHGDLRHLGETLAVQPDCVIKPARGSSGRGVVLLTGPADGSAPKKKKAAAAPVELFNLAEDPSEKTNLAAKHPQKVKELRARYDAFAQQAVAAKGGGPQPAGFKAPKVWGEKP